MNLIICFVSSTLFGSWISKKDNEGKTRNWIALATLIFMIFPLKIADSWWGFLLFFLGVALGQFIFQYKYDKDSFW